MSGIGGVLGVEGNPPLFNRYSHIPAGMPDVPRPAGATFAQTMESLGPVGPVRADELGLMGDAARIRYADSGTPYAALFNQAGAKYGIAPSLLAAVAKVESNYNPNAVSPDGAQGLMQFMPETAKSRGVNPWDPSSAIDGAASLLVSLYEQFGSVTQALAAYNGGPGWLARQGGVPSGGPANYAKKVLSWVR